MQKSLRGSKVYDRQIMNLTILPVEPKGADNMSGKKDKPIDLSKVTPDEKMKYEIAEELGLLDQMAHERMESAVIKETGRIGDDHKKAQGSCQIITEMLISMNFSCHCLQRNNPFDTIS